MGVRAADARAAGARALAALAIVFAGCGGSAASVPDLGGDAVEIIVLAAFEDGTAPASAIQLDSVSFGLLGTVVGADPYSAAELEQRVRRDITPVHPDEVLECPAREPCRLRSDGDYITLWDASSTGDVLRVTVSRVRNVEHLHTMTEHTTWHLVLARTGSGWRLTGRSRVP